MKMIKWLVAAGLAGSFFALMAWGSSPSPLGGSNTSRGNLERIPDYNTIQTNAWYVDPDGGDTGNTCLSPSSPCKTIQRVLTLISAKHLRHQQAIYAAPGNYPCVVISGYQTDQGFAIGAAGPITTASGAGIVVIGTLADSALDAGTASGTITGSTTGQATVGFTPTEVRDNTQTWKADQLKGRFVTFGNFTRQVIYGNDAGAFSIITANAAPANGTTYHIQDAVSFFNTGTCQLGGSVGIAIDGGFSAPLSTQGAFIVTDTTPGGQSTQYRLQQFAFSNPTGTDVVINSPAGVGLQDVQFQNSADGTRVSAGYSQLSLSLVRGAFRQSAGSTSDNVTSLPQTKGIMSISNSLFENGNSAANSQGDTRNLFQVNAMNPITSFGFNLFGDDSLISQFICEGNTVPVNACVRHGTLTNGAGVSHGQAIVQSMGCHIGPSGGLCLDMQGPGVATIFNSELATDAGLPSDTTTALIRELYGAGVNMDLTTTFTAPSPNNLVLFSNTNSPITFQILGVQASVPPCASDAIGNWFCSPP